MSGYQSDIIPNDQVTNRMLFTSYGTFGGNLGIDENELGSTYLMPAGTLVGTDALEINVGGNIQGGAGNKTLRAYIGSALVFEYVTNVVGDWAIKIIGGRFTSDVLKGEASIVHSGVSPRVQYIQTAGLDMDSTDQLIRITHQNDVDAPNQINRFSYLIKHYREPD